MGWQVQEAKQKFSELVRRAVEHGPQIITRHGQEIAVIVSAAHYRELTGGDDGFKAFLLSAPDLESLDIRRTSEPAGTVDL